MSKSYNGLNKFACDVENELETFMKLYVLLYADDTVVLAESAVELQAAMNELNQYCQKWSLSILYKCHHNTYFLERESA